MYQRRATILLVLFLSAHSSMALSTRRLPRPFISSPDKEIFSVAPMMAHTNRHYRYFFRLLSHCTWLYTEMIPAGQILQSFQGAAASHIMTSKTKLDVSDWSTDQLFEVSQRIRQDYQRQRSQNAPMGDTVLEELLNPSDGQNGGRSVVLQVGGRDPRQLQTVAAIGAAFGYQGINLNCGCPSASVSGRATGAALMREPETVSRCVEAMSKAIDRIHTSGGTDMETVLSVKHRLGVMDAATYDALKDHQQDDSEAYESCRAFLEAITHNANVSRVQVHARVALLGLDSEKSSSSSSSPTSVWVPNTNQEASQPITAVTTKVNHSRVQYMAKKEARQATIQNRSVPPLRPGVVKQIAQDFSRLQVSTNGGIESLEEIQDRLSGEDNQIQGAMVGRAAINHPCSFAAADSVLWGAERTALSRGKVLQRYIDYCQEEEQRLSNVTKRGELEAHRKRLVAPPFHLFMGEDGNEAFQRRLRKMTSRADRHPAHSMLAAAMAEVPMETLNKDISDHIAWKDIPKYDFNKRSGAMQRTIY